MQPTTDSGKAHGKERPVGMPTNTEILAIAGAPVNPVGGRAKPLGDALVGEAQDPSVPMGQAVPHAVQPMEIGLGGLV